MTEANKACNCGEGFIQRASVNGDGNAIAEVRAPMVHDCAYIAARNALIPEAEQIALQETRHIDKALRGRAFAAPFMAAMQRLWRERKP